MLTKIPNRSGTTPVINPFCAFRARWNDLSRQREASGNLEMPYWILIFSGIRSREM